MHTTRYETREYVLAQRALDPLAFGPYIGTLALNLGITAGLFSELSGIHAQTINRWWLRRSVIKPAWGARIGKAVAFLAWLHDTQQDPLVGSIDQRRVKLADHMRRYREAITADIAADIAAE